MGIQVKNDAVYYDVFRMALNNGTAGTETAVSLTTFTPPEAKLLNLYALVGAAGGYGTASTWELVIRTKTGVDYATIQTANYSGATVNTTNYGTFPTPNVAQNVYYIVRRIDGSGGAGNGYIWMLGYTIPNGG